MKRIGITGGMGCGKSTVVASFERLGVPCFVADSAGAECYDDPDFLRRLYGLLGDEVRLPDGHADKAAVAAKVFADDGLLQSLNALVHPMVMQKFDSFCQLHFQAEYVLFESAILFDYGFDKLMDSVVCVYLDLEERLRRLAERDKVDRERLMARIARQMPAEAVMMRANYVILNYEGNPRERQVRYVDECIRKGASAML